MPYTYRKNEPLAALERRLLRLAARAPGVMFSYRRNTLQCGHLQYISPTIQTLAGLRAEDVENDISLLNQRIHPADRTALTKAIEDSAEIKEPYHVEFRLLHPSLGLRWIEARAAPEHESDGNILWHGFMIDISEQKELESKLRAKEAKLRHLYEISPLGIALTDLNGRFLEFNEAFRAICGHDAETLKKLDYWTLTPADYQPQEAAQIKSLLERGRYGPYEKAYIRDNGERIPVQLNGILTTGKHGQRYIWSIVEDISERKRLAAELSRRESEFRMLAENSPDTIIRYDAAGCCVYCNPVATTTLGIAALADLRSLAHAEETFPESAVNEFATCVQRTLSFGEYAEMEFSWQQWDMPACLQLRITPELDGDGKVSSALVVGRDVSALKQAEARLRKSHDILRALAQHLESEQEEVKRQIAYQIHEDLAQNLSVLNMQLSLLQKTPALAPFAPSLDGMRTITDYCIARIRDMVSKLRPAVLEFGIVPALQWLAANLRESAGLEFDLKIEDGPPLGNETQTFLFRAAQEALANISLHAAASHVEVSLTFPDGSCHLRIRDNGHGFDVSTLHSAPRFGLLGLQEQAHHLGGSFRVQSTPGQGTLIEIAIPGSSTASGQPITG